MSSLPLTFAEYQKQALAADRLPASGDDGLVLPLLGLVGEVGALAAEWKKRRRDVEGYRGFPDELREELGDALWYMAVLADRANLQLSDIAESNLAKVDDAFGAGEQIRLHHVYDEDRPESERLPRLLRVSFREATIERGGDDVPGVLVKDFDTGDPIGDALDDNRDVEDDYRYHDVLHMAHMAVLGWSPVMRATLSPKRKRRGGRIDRVEDGGRAIAIEEGLTAAVFAAARDHSFFATADRVPRGILKSCIGMTSHLEVADRSAGDWQKAIFAGYYAFNYLVEHREGLVVADMIQRTLTCEPLTA